MWYTITHEKKVSQSYQFIDSVNIYSYSLTESNGDKHKEIGQQQDHIT